MLDTKYPNIFRIKTGKNEIATGFLIDRNGHIITVAHLFEDENIENIECANEIIKFNAKLIYKPGKNEELDFVILEAEKTFKQEEIEPLEFNFDDIEDNIEIYGYGYGLATQKHKENPQIFNEFKLNKFGGKVSLGAGYSFEKVSNIRYVMEGDSGSPIFDNKTKKVIGIIYAREYIRITGQDIHRGYFLPLKIIAEHLKLKNLSFFTDYKKSTNNDKIPDEQLEKMKTEELLSSFDFKRVRRSFRNFFDYTKRENGVFLLHGQQGNGQRWIAKQLLSFIGIKNTNVITIISEATLENFIKGIRRDIVTKEKVRFKKQSDLLSNISIIKEWILNKKDDVVFPFCCFFSNAEENEIDNFFEEFIDKFWLPIQDVIKNKKFIILFIEEKELKHQSKFIIEDYKKYTDASVLLLPKLGKSKEEMIIDLDNWINEHVKNHKDAAIKNIFKDFFDEDDCRNYIEEFVESFDDLLENIYHDCEIPFKIL